MKEVKKEKLIGATGTVSGITSLFGSWQVCHTVCLWLIAALSILGITIVGMPLLFLTKVAVPFWIVAIVLFLITLYFYFTRKCISTTMIMFNSGVLIAGIPFQAVQPIIPYLYIIGGFLVATSIVLFIKKKMEKKT